MNAPRFSSSEFNRRRFLQLAGGSLLGLIWLPALRPLFRLGSNADHTVQLGRIADATVSLFETPSRKGKLVRTLWRDLVLPITAATIGDKEPNHNRVWYEINGEGYVHSGSVQPVSVVVNRPADRIIGEGRLAEVTVPFTDSLWNPLRPKVTAYRLYYETTYWITDVVYDADDKPFYRIKDDYYNLSHFADARHMRLIPMADMAPLSSQVLAGDKRLEVNLEAQTVTAYEKKNAVFESRISSGSQFSNGDYTTPRGVFSTYYKRPSRHMAFGNLANPNSYDLPGVPWVCYIEKRGIAFHGTYWHNDFGRPRSHGCINLPSSAARWIYRWTLPSVPFEEILGYEDPGTRVDIV